MHRAVIRKRQEIQDDSPSARADQREGCRNNGPDPVCIHPEPMRIPEKLDALMNRK